MLHTCVQKFDVTGTVENFLGTKQGRTGNMKSERVSCQEYEVKRIKSV